MTSTPPDRSRDRRIEDPTNLWLVHPTAHALLGLALRARISANAVSLAGLAIGAGAAFAFGNWQHPWAVAAGLIASFLWLVADGLDGMVARATHTASALGRLLDGVCDHGVFVLIYVALALSIGTVEGWVLAVVAGAAHAFQSSLYEAERARFHRRLRGDPATAAPARSGSLLERGYDRVAGVFDRSAARFDAWLGTDAAPAMCGARYATDALLPMRLMALGSANMRVLAIGVACALSDPRLFWWIEIVPMTIVMLVALVWLRRVESSLLPSGAAVSRLGV